MIKVDMTLERETKGAVRYKEDNQDDYKIGTLYIRKSAFPERVYPKHIKVHVSAQ